jgi:hypothetical protein
MRRAHRSPEASTLLSVYDGQRLAGFLKRGREGCAAYDTDNQPLGIFPDQHAAIIAIVRLMRIAPDGPPAVETQGK